ncbi:hypothetical protein INS49_003979 [Diaporthe citri]|uniref:uncharacterized protein n=1 Tax=Diaporthe citri TaxID=83186 RepID=UPI001C7F87C6|nr:uncharacterized protein INS49_003979 [Diaporthe citri]KAG6354898.1 hypothetical protein INS49_003979 [Diaporthe citri]
MSAAPSQDQAAELIRCIRFWRYRSDLETGPCMTERNILTSEDIVGIRDPVFLMTTEDISRAVRSLLRRNRSWFDRVEQQLQSMLQLWQIVMQQKKRFDDLNGLAAISPHREFLEAILLTGRFIPARASLVPESRPQKNEKREGGHSTPFLVVEPQKKK